MKKTHFLLFLMTIFIGSVAANAAAQDHQAKNMEISIDAKGGIYNHGGTKLGYIDKDNIVRNNKGQKIYFIDRDGNVIDANGKKLGMTKKNGSYYNVKGENVLNTRDLDK